MNNFLKKVIVPFFVILTVSYGCVPPFKGIIQTKSINNNIYGQWRFEMDYLANDSLVQQKTGIILFKHTNDKDSSRTYEQIMNNGNKVSSFGWYGISGDSGGSDLTFIGLRSFDSTLVYDGILSGYKKTDDKDLKKQFKFSELNFIDSLHHHDTIVKLTLNCLYNKTRNIDQAI